MENILAGDASAERDIFDVLKEIGAFQEGHFILSSGLHSSAYIQCALVMKNPKIAGDICSRLAKKISSYLETNKKKIDICLSPAMGGIIVGYEVARQLGVESVFAERDSSSGALQLRRSFTIPPKARVLIVEDVVSTGISAHECVLLAENCNAKVIAVASIIDRSQKNSLKLSIPLISLIKINAPFYSKKEIPQWLHDISAIKPGSRKKV